MLTSLAQWLQTQNPDWGFLRVFQYLTFRAVMAAMTALVIGLALGPMVIRRLTKLKIPSLLSPKIHSFLPTLMASKS